MSVDDYVERFRARVIQDALAEALPGYWLRRAECFESARHRPGDFRGESTDEQLAARDAALVALVDECRRRASHREALDQQWWRPLIEEALGVEHRS